MNQGRLVEYGPSELIYADPRDEYTRRLISAIPQVSEEKLRQRLRLATKKRLYDERICSTSRSPFAATPFLRERLWLVHAGKTYHENLLLGLQLFRLAKEVASQCGFRSIGAGSNCHFTRVEGDRKLLCITGFDQFSAPKFPTGICRRVSHLLLPVVEFWDEIEANPAILQSMAAQLQNTLKFARRFLRSFFRFHSG